VRVRVRVRVRTCREKVREIARRARRPRAVSGVIPPRPVVWFRVQGSEVERGPGLEFRVQGHQGLDRPGTVRGVISPRPVVWFRTQG